MNRCRLCLENPGGEAIIREKLLNDMLEMVFQMQFQIDDSLPDKICDDCVFKVKFFYEYKERVHRTQQQLREEQLQKSYDTKMVKLEICVKKESVQENSAIETSTNAANTVSGLLDGKAILDERTEQIEEINVFEMDVEHDEEHIDSIVDGSFGARKNSNHTVPDECEMDKLYDKRAEEDNRIKEYFSMVCEICSLELSNFYQLQTHFRKVHNLRGFIKCCNQKFYRKFKVLDHISLHMKPDAYRCEVCKKNYRSRYTLQQHNSLCHGEPKDRPFKCDKCHQAYEKEYQLKAHFSRHVQLPCHLCGRVLSSAQSLRVHLEHMHGNDRQQICDTCGESFRTKPALERHIRRHSGQDIVIKLQCLQCGIWVNGTRGLKNHTRNVHPDKDEVFECEICHQRCKNAATLYQHRKGVHAEDQYQCDFCGKRFKRKIYLKEHRASHTGESLYSCDVCGLKTNSNANMYSHKKNKHPVEWREAQLKKQAAAAAAVQQSLAKATDEKQC